MDDLFVVRHRPNRVAGGLAAPSEPQTIGAYRRRRRPADAQRVWQADQDARGRSRRVPRGASARCSTVSTGRTASPDALARRRARRAGATAASCSRTCAAPTGGCGWSSSAIGRRRRRAVAVRGARARRCIRTYPDFPTWIDVMGGGGELVGPVERMARARRASALRRRAPRPLARCRSRRASGGGSSGSTSGSRPRRGPTSTVRVVRALAAAVGEAVTAERPAPSRRCNATPSARWSSTDPPRPTSTPPTTTHRRST